MEFEYINSYYKVSAYYGRDIMVSGRLGTIKEDLGNYLGVIFHDDIKKEVYPVHPTSETVYLETTTDLKKLRTRNWKAKERYRHYLSLDGCYDTFFDYLKNKAYENI